VTEFEFDGLRIDTLVWVPKWFWKKFSEASGVYTIGEAMDGDLDFVSKYVGCVDAVLNYPQFFLMRDLFLHQKDMTDI
jgi:alpha-amylase